jgi:dipeptidyl aminopeptidase/acylaminoacyl peptidase
VSNRAQTIRRLSTRAALTAAIAGLARSLVTGQGQQACSGEEPCALTEGLPDGSFFKVQLSPDGRRAIFTYRYADPNLSDDLYSVPVDGSASATKLNEHPSVGDVVISPDSTRIVYSAQVPMEGKTFFSVPAAGPASRSIRVASDVGSGEPPQISPNGRLIVFLSRRRDRIRAVPIAGPANGGTRLTQILESGRIERFKISPDGKSVVYLANQDDINTTELYRVPLTRSPEPSRPTVKLNALPVTGGKVRDFWIAPDPGPVVYLADQDTLDVPELYAVRLGGAGGIKLSLPLPPNWEVGASGFDDAVPVKIFPDGSRVGYQIQEKIFQDRPRVQLYSVPIAGPGTESVRLDQPPGEAPDANSHLFEITADSSHVVHTMAAGNPDAPILGLFTVPATGPATAGALLSTSTFAEVVLLSPNGERALWYPDTGTSLVSFLTGRPGEGTAVLDGDEQPGGVLITPSSRRVVYEVFVEGVGITALFTAPIDGTAPAQNVTGSLSGFFDLEAIASDGARVVYSVRDAANNEVLYSSPLPLEAAGSLPSQQR